MSKKINLIYWIIFCISLTALIIGSLAFSKISPIRQPPTVPADTGDPLGICSGRQDAFAASGIQGNPATVESVQVLLLRGQATWVRGVGITTVQSTGNQ